MVLICLCERGQDLGQQKPEPEDQEAEVVAGSGEDGVDGVAGLVGEVVSAHAVLGLEVSDDRLDGGPASELAFDLIGDAALLAAGEDLQAVFVGGVVAAIAGVGEDAGEVHADLLFQSRAGRSPGCGRHKGRPAEP